MIIKSNLQLMQTPLLDHVPKPYIHTPFKYFKMFDFELLTV